MIELYIITDGSYALVSDEDSDLVERKWYLGRGDRPQCVIQPRPNQKMRFLHQIVMERILGHSIPCGMEVDHKDRNPRNSQRGNLRLATQLQNKQNVGLRVSNTTGFIGIRSVGKRWQANIRMDGSDRYLGTYDTREAAARAYDAKAKEVRGEFAVLNFPD